MLLVRAFCHVNVSKETEQLARSDLKGLETASLEVTNPNLVGQRLRDLQEFSRGGLVVSRVIRDGVAEVAQPDFALRLGDVIHTVGTRERLNSLKMLVGRESALDVKAVSKGITTRRLVVTKRDVIGKTIESLDMLGRYGVTLTRTSRADVEIAATAGWRFQFGDVVQAVGSVEALNRAAAEVGNSMKRLDSPQIIPIFLGIALGVILGSMPIPIPGVPMPVRLGLAGGPLLVAIVLSRIGQIGPLSWYMSWSANSTIRELGIGLFLACVGLKAGDQFVATLMNGDGLYWMGCAAIITALPLLVVGFVARMVFKMNFVPLCGVLRGR